MLSPGDSRVSGASSGNTGTLGDSPPPANTTPQPQREHETNPQVTLWATALLDSWDCGLMQDNEDDSKP